MGQDFSVKILYYKCGVTGDADASSAVSNELFFHVITTNVMFFFHFTPHGFLYCHVSHNLLFSNISQYLLKHLPLFFSHISRMCYSMAPPWPFPDLTLRLPVTFLAFPHHFPHHSSSIFLHSSPHTTLFNDTSPTFPWPYPAAPRTFLAFPHHFPPSFLVNFPPFLTPLKHYRIVIC